MHRKRNTYPNWHPGAQKCSLSPTHHTPRVPDDAVDSESRQPHRRKALENGPLGHNHAVILRERDFRRGPGRERVLRFPILAAGRQRPAQVARSHAADYLVAGDLTGISVRLARRGQRAPVAQVCLVPLVADVAEKIGPRDTVGRADYPWVGDGAERFPNVGGVCDIPMGGEEDGADAIGVCGIAVWGFG